MNYLIIFLKSDSLKLDIGSMTGAACLSEEGVFYAFHGVCQPLIFAVDVSLEHLANLLTNRRFYPSSPLATLGVPGSGCVLYGFAAGSARGFSEKNHFNVTRA
ncbi:hypothetical protein [Vreelandella malpeensis]|uniref:Uncharacterized protein n=1 Tax=Vreelandella malpeensis TaxID=1172368 RepID=A0ABS8DST2_9GAMM|nr:hypothetical protein [Halomonas malpeensis]MCB8889095.1 hypothetical protein [Halomonas malpeensis]